MGKNVELLHNLMPAGATSSPICPQPPLTPLAPPDPLAFRLPPPSRRGVTTCKQVVTARPTPLGRSYIPLADGAPRTPDVE